MYNRFYKCNRKQVLMTIVLLKTGPMDFRALETGPVDFFSLENRSYN